ncbi:MAG: AAA family ATPase [Tissierellia bacterium]|nr:AAA family ATPase [Tissierellia bacterium]
MIYIEKIIIDNFQSHDHTELELGPKVNVIIGPSDSGKTAIIRAIRWVLYNEPQGDYFVRKGTTHARVTLIFSNGFKVTRGRDKSKNYYDIEMGDMKNHYEGFGSNVPEEINEYTGIRKIDLDKNNSTELNIADQLEAPFLLTTTPSTKSDALGRLSGVHIIDKALGRLSKDIHGAKQNIRQEKTRMNEKKDALKQYDYLEKEEKELNEQIKILFILKKRQESMAQLKEIQTEFNCIESSIKEIEKVLESTQYVDRLKPMINLLREREKEFNECRQLSILYQQNKKEIGTIEKIIRESSDVLNVAPLLRKLEDCDDLYRRYINMKEQERDTREQMKKQEEIIASIPSQKMIHYFHELTKRLEKYQLVLDIQKRWIDCNRRIQMGKQYMKKFDGMEKSLEMIQKGITIQKNYEKLQDIHMQLEMNHKQAQEEWVEYQNSKTMEDSLIDQYADLLRQEKICPLCMGTVDEAHIQRIIKELRRRT